VFTGWPEGAYGWAAMPADLPDDQLVGVLQRYLTILQGHPSADEMIKEILTEDFETGFIGGQLWKGEEGLRDFLSQRDGFFDEKHTIEELLQRGEIDGEIEAHTRLHFFLRSWQAQQLFATPDEGLNR
jgi:hypothetical protein